ncbi:MAG: sulfite exporter TauE/SafE family protein [Candidatus Hydrogenedentota bacterium]
MLEGFIEPGIPVPMFWVMVGSAIIILGISKSGLSGGAILSLPLMMMVMPVDKVAATMLPLLVLCDMNAIYHHRRNVVWKKVSAIYFPAIIGIGIGTVIWWYIGQNGVEQYAVPLKRFVGVIALLFGFYIFEKETSMSWVAEHRAGPVWAVIAGVCAGTTTTMAHAAGPIVSLYLFSQGMGKQLFVGTMVWTFMLLNLTKLPFYGAIGMIQADILLFDLWLAPLIPVGSFLGKWLLNRFTEQTFNRVVMTLTLIAGIQLTFNIQLIGWLLERFG